MNYQQVAEGQVSPEVPINENMEALSQAFLWSHRVPADTGFTVGYGGGNFAETTVADGTLACTNNTTNYIVVNRSTLVASVATTTTNWDNTTTYGRVASVAFASGVLTTWNDERYSPGGIFDSAAAVLGAIAAADVSVADTGGYFTGTDVEAVLQEVGAALGGFGTGDVTGPGSAVDGHLVQFDGTTGKLLKDGIALDTDTTLAANSDTRVATQKAVKTYVDNAVTGLWDVKGSTDCSANPNYPAASKGDAYVVSVAGKIGGASGTSVDVGDVFVALADNAGGTEASVGTSWFHIEHNLVGVALTSGNLSQFASTTSAQLAGVISDETGTGALVFANSPTLVTPALGTPASGNLANCTGLPVAGGGTGVASLTAYAPVFGGTTSTGAVQSGTVGTAGQVLQSNGAGALPTFQAQPFDIHAFYPGVPSASAKVLRVPVARAVSLPANFSGSYGKASVAATASTAFDVQKNGSTIGTITFALGATTATFTTSGGSAQSLAAGDVLSIIAPVSPDASLADVGFVLAGTR